MGGNLYMLSPNFSLTIKDLKLGFKIHSETAPQVYVFDKINFIKYKNNQIPENISDALQSNNYNFEIVKNSGNIKLVYTL